MEEIWIEVKTPKNSRKTIIAISNKGNVKYNDGSIVPATIRKQFKARNGAVVLVHRFIAENFIPKTAEDIALGRNCVDHITHNPNGINIDDVRNLRWCTHKENSTFPEAIANQIAAAKTRKRPQNIKKVNFVGSNNPFFGKHHTEETKEKMRLSHLGKKYKKRDEI